MTSGEKNMQSTNVTTSLASRANFPAANFNERKVGSLSLGKASNFNPQSGKMDAIIIVDHGSRRKESNLMLNDFVDMFREKTGYPIVEPAHMELATPTIKDAFESCVKQGAERVIISPYFLFPGRHWCQDIPSLAAEAANDHPGVPYVVTAPLGLHTLLVEVVNDRIKHCLSRVEGHEDECEACKGTNKCKVYNSTGKL